MLEPKTGQFEYVAVRAARRRPADLVTRLAPGARIAAGGDGVGDLQSAEQFGDL